MTSQVRRLSLVVSQGRTTASGRGSEAPADPAGAGGRRGAWTDGFAAGPVCYPDFDEAPTTRELRCGLALFHRFGEHLVALAEGALRPELLPALVQAGQDICWLLNDRDTVAGAIVARSVAAMEPLLDAAIADATRGRTAVLGNPWLVLGLFDGFGAVAGELLQAATQRDRRASATPGHQRINQQVVRQFLDRLATLCGAFAAAAGIALPAGRAGRHWLAVDAVTPDATATHAQLAAGFRLVAARRERATDRQEIADLTAAIASIEDQIRRLEQNGAHAAPGAAAGAARVLENILRTAPRRASGELRSFLGQVEHYLDTLGSRWPVASATAVAPGWPRAADGPHGGRAEGGGAMPAEGERPAGRHQPSAAAMRPLVQPGPAA